MVVRLKKSVANNRTIPETAFTTSPLIDFGDFHEGSNFMIKIRIITAMSRRRISTIINYSLLPDNKSFLYQEIKGEYACHPEHTI
jgi:hypothetical protein